ncbi:hypothetical protein Tco_0048795, partial [Tanacetum coccineum]
VTPTPNATPTITVTEAQLQALIDQGVASAMAEAEASRVRNGYNSNGTEGVVGLTRWFEKMEYTTTTEAAHAIPWASMKKMMTDKYCPRGEIKKIETEMIFPEVVDKIEKYIGGLPDMILGRLRASMRRPMHMLNVKQKRKESMMIFPRTIKTNNSRIRGRIQARPTLQAIVTGTHTPGLNLYVPSVITIMKVLVHLGVITAKRLAIWPRIIEADLQMLTTTTETTTTIIRREMVAMSAELKDTLKETA